MLITERHTETHEEESVLVCRTLPAHAASIFNVLRVCVALKGSGETWDLLQGFCRALISVSRVCSDPAELLM